jgi:hypothetical protein
MYSLHLTINVTVLNMDYSLLAWRLGKQIGEKRINRGYTQAKLAGLMRQKVIAV